MNFKQLHGGGGTCLSAPNNCFGFTLAEVLVTLGVIGVVAALILPNLIENHREKVVVTQLKEFYSIFQQALLLSKNDNGEYYSENNSLAFYNYIKPYLKIQKDCGPNQGCFADTMVKTLNGADWVNINSYRNYQKLILSSGALLQIYNGADWKDKAEIRVDINGFKKPNVLGRDIFYFRVKDNKIIPEGVPDDDRPFETHCNKSSNLDYNGDSCSAWVIYNENMDYLHCNDLSWNGKHKCN